MGPPGDQSKSSKPYTQGQHQQVINQAYQSTKKDYAEVYYNIIGALIKEQGKLEDAINAYKKAISLKPDYADANNNMGNTLQDQGKPDEAIEAYSTHSP